MSNEVDNFLNWNSDKSKSSKLDPEPTVDDLIEEDYEDEGDNPPPPKVHQRKRRDRTESESGDAKRDTILAQVAKSQTEDYTAQPVPESELTGDAKRDYIVSQLKNKTALQKADSEPKLDPEDKSDWDDDEPETEAEADEQVKSDLEDEADEHDKTIELKDKITSILNGEDADAELDEIEEELEDQVSRVCIYHAKCDDGFGSAYAVYKKFGKEAVAFVPTSYGTYPDLELLHGKEVIIADFSFKRDVTKDILAVVKHLTILDHHKTAEAEIEGLEDEHDNLTVVFDMERSGCGITWDYFFPGEERPDLLSYIEDSDIAKFEFRDTKEIIRGLRSYPRLFHVWENLNMVSLFKSGIPIARYMDINVQTILESDVLRKRICGYNVPVVNAPRFVGVRATELLIKNEDFVASYYESNEGRIYSLRSGPDGIDVSEIAAQFGGGGHARAAGFTVTKANKHLIKRVSNPRKKVSQ